MIVNKIKSQQNSSRLFKLKYYYFETIKPIECKHKIDRKVLFTHSLISPRFSSSVKYPRSKNLKLFYNIYFKVNNDSNRI